MTESRIILGDCLDVLPTLPAERVDSIVTDPPYGLGFMGQAWDHGVPGVPFWEAVLRVAKPGAWLLAFGGTRTWHRLACAIEDAGWELRDTVCWLYGSGFPKSLDISKAIDKAAGAERPITGIVDAPATPGPGTFNRSFDVSKAVITAPATDAAKLWNGWGTALKPAWEPIIVAMKPLDGTFAANALKYGVAGLNIDGCRIKASGPSPSIERRKGKPLPPPSGVWPTWPDRKAWGAPHWGEGLGRWPANLVHDGSEQVLAGFPESDGQAGDVRGTEPSHTGQRGIYGDFARTTANRKRGDSGSAARFFFCAKASRAEREAGLEDLACRSPGEVTGGRIDGSAGLQSPRAGAGRTSGARNHHPTVKPLALMRWLVRLVGTPTGGLVLDPFMGSGTTGIACVAEGREFIGIEKEPEYAEIARRRIAHAKKEAFGPLFAEAAAPSE